MSCKNKISTKERVIADVWAVAAVIVMFFATRTVMKFIAAPSPTALLLTMCDVGIALAVIIKVRYVHLKTFCKRG